MDEQAKLFWKDGHNVAGCAFTLSIQVMRLIKHEERSNGKTCERCQT
jgi:hypothetical protein